MQIKIFVLYLDLDHNKNYQRFKTFFIALIRLLYFPEQGARPSNNSPFKKAVIIPRIGVVAYSEDTLVVR